jgi:hypothetical protein
MQTCSICHEVRFKIGVEVEYPGGWKPTEGMSLFYPARVCSTKCANKAVAKMRADRRIDVAEVRAEDMYIDREVAAGRIPA